MADELSVWRSQEQGHDRLYVETAEGCTVGWLCLRTGTLTIEMPGAAGEVLRALARRPDAAPALAERRSRLATAPPPPPPPGTRMTPRLAPPPPPGTPGWRSLAGVRLPPPPPGVPLPPRLLAAQSVECRAEDESRRPAYRFLGQGRGYGARARRASTR